MIELKIVLVALLAFVVFFLIERHTRPERTKNMESLKIAMWFETKRAWRRDVRIVDGDWIFHFIFDDLHYWVFAGKIFMFRPAHNEYAESLNKIPYKDMLTQIQGQIESKGEFIPLKLIKKAPVKR